MPCSGSRSSDTHTHTSYTHTQIHTPPYPRELSLSGSQRLGTNEAKWCWSLSVKRSQAVKQPVRQLVEVAVWVCVNQLNNLLAIYSVNQLDNQPSSQRNSYPTRLPLKQVSSITSQLPVSCSTSQVANWTINRSVKSTCHLFNQYKRQPAGCTFLNI